MKVSISSLDLEWLSILKIHFSDKLKKGAISKTQDNKTFSTMASDTADVVSFPLARPGQSLMQENQAF